MASGFIYLIILGMWAAYFLPKWMISHDVASGKSAERYKSAMRVVGETGSSSIANESENFGNANSIAGIDNRNKNISDNSDYNNNYNNNYVPPTPPSVPPVNNKKIKEVNTENIKKFIKNKVESSTELDKEFKSQLMEQPFTYPHGLKLCQNK